MAERNTDHISSTQLSAALYAVNGRLERIETRNEEQAVYRGTQTQSVANLREEIARIAAQVEKNTQYLFVGDGKESAKTQLARLNLAMERIESGFEKFLIKQREEVNTFLQLHQATITDLRNDIEKVQTSFADARSALSIEETRGKWSFRTTLIQVIVGGSGAGFMLILQKLLG